MEDTPTLQQATTDGVGILKRRRPALACVECRRRKVKCDREKPCGPCTRTKSPTCTYRSHPRASPRIIGSPVRTTSSSASTNEEQQSPRSTHIDHNRDVLRQAEKNKTFQELIDRVRHLEGILRSSEQPLQTEITEGVEKDVPRSPVGQFVKAKFYGESHWNNVLEPYDSLRNSDVTVNTNSNRTEIDKTSELYTTVAECKRMARTIKASRVMQPSILREIHAFIPPRHVCDQLVQCYLRTFEGVFRILHIPSFMEDYEAFWLDSAAASPSILLLILLVCAVGVVFYTGPEQPRLRADCTKWLQAAESWLSAPHAKSRFNMAGTQISVLILLARQVCSVDGDLVWVPGGRLLRGAMHLGLHRDPRHMGKISVFHAEMRRRIWATILEFTVQSSLDMGMPPMISPDDYDTLPPSNVNDEDLIATDTASLQPRPLTEYTQCSIQIAFYETLPLRLEICRLINSLRISLSYDDTLKLGADMLAACREKTSLLQSFVNTSVQHAPNAFQIKLLDTLMRRFYLCLHRPFFGRAAHDPKYYYSRKVCLDTSLIIATPTVTPLEGGEEDDWVRLTHRGVGFVKSFFLHSLSTIYFELTSRLEKEREEPLSVPFASSRNTGIMALPPDLEPYYKMLVYARSVTQKRLGNGEVNAKGYTWLCSAVARVEALLSHSDPDAAVLAAAKKAVNDTAVLMRKAYYDEHGEHIDLSRPFTGRDHGRGEGADDVTGTPRNVGRLDGFDANGSSNWGGSDDMDWERLMRDEGWDMGWGLGGSPESWFGWGWDTQT